MLLYQNTKNTHIKNYTSKKAVNNDVSIYKVWGFHSVHIMDSAFWVLADWVSLLLILEVWKKWKAFIFIGQGIQTSPLQMEVFLGSFLRNVNINNPATQCNKKPESSITFPFIISLHIF
jgi:hypothetical protein